MCAPVLPAYSFVTGLLDSVSIPQNWIVRTFGCGLRCLTQVQLARKIGETQTFVSKCERGERRIDVGHYTLRGLNPGRYTVSAFAADGQRHAFKAITVAAGQDIETEPSRGCLMVNAREAAQVREIFGLFLRYKSLDCTLAEMHRRGWQMKSWTTRKGQAHAGRRFFALDVPAVHAREGAEYRKTTILPGRSALRAPGVWAVRDTGTQPRAGYRGSQA
jgi:hypothetical protein